MGEKENLICSYIANIVGLYLPKHEETIHSGLFLSLLDEPKLKIPDWYFNGYSVISETISSYIQELCKSKIIGFSSDGEYVFETNQKQIPNEFIEKTKKNVKLLLANFASSNQMIHKANEVFTKLIP
ncbi:MAG: hypothetical protein ACTSYV_03320 [Candidatus Heimdallarchaeaceae archaeon]